MNPPDDLLRENQALRQRLALLSQASLSINESLDFRSVLQEVVDSARSLTASRYGAITVFGEDGQTDFIVSGMTQEEHQGLWDMREGLGFFEYLSGLAEPLRVPNIDDHLRALNMPEFLPSVPVTSLLVAPDPPPRGRGRHHLPDPRGGRRGVHPGGRGDLGAVRRPSGPGHRQRPPPREERRLMEEGAAPAGPDAARPPTAWS